MKNSKIFLYRRMGLAQEIDKFYYEPHNNAKCHKQGYKRFGMHLCAVTYPTYMRYLKAVIPEEHKQPERIIAGIRDIILKDMQGDRTYSPLLDECETIHKVE